MDATKFQSLAQSAMNEREMRSLSGGNVCGCASNSTMDNGSANHAGNLNSKGATMSEMTYFMDEVVVTASHAVATETNFEICE
jgi:natural product precursor